MYRPERVDDTYLHIGYISVIFKKTLKNLKMSKVLEKWKAYNIYSFREINCTLFIVYIGPCTTVRCCFLCDKDSLQFYTLQGMNMCVYITCF